MNPTEPAQGMDRPLAVPRNRGWRKHVTTVKLALTVVAVVSAVSAIVPLGLYLLMVAELPGSQPAASPGVRDTVAAPDTPVVFFDNALVVDVERGAILRDLDVLVEHGRIAAVGSLTAPPGAISVDARGRYLMPGLIDTHVHLATDRDLLLFLASGVTTVQSLGGDIGENAARAAAVRTGAVAGPSVVSCDYVVRGLSSAADVDRHLDAAGASGSGCIKIYSPPDWTAEAHRTLVRRARERGLRIGGHLPRNLPLEDGLGNGQQFVAHAEEFLYAHFFKFPDRLNESRIARVATLTRNVGVAISPTLVAYHRIVEQVGPGIEALLRRPELAYVQDETLDEWKPPANRYRQRFTPDDGVGLGAAFAFQQKLVKAWAAAGVPLTIGSDASPRMPFVVPGFSVLEELEELAQAGLTPAEVLRAATVEGARLTGQSDETGTVAEGRRADLLMLESNPLESMSNVGGRLGVMANGRWMPEKWLREKLEGVKVR